MSGLHFVINTGNPKIDEALTVAFSYGQTDGAHHKLWVIDQIVRVLAGDRYDEFVAKFQNGAYGPHTYGWETGTVP